MQEQENARTGQPRTGQSNVPPGGVQAPDCLRDPADPCSRLISSDSRHDTTTTTNNNDNNNNNKNNNDNNNYNNNFG